MLAQSLAAVAPSAAASTITLLESPLAAARNRLIAHGYAATTLRAVAADVGVDVALISYYFRSKQGLFSAVIALTVSPPAVLTAALEGELARLPERSLAAVLTVWDDPRTGEPLRALVTAALQEPSGQRALVEFLEREVITRLADGLGGPRATERAAAAASTIAGLVFTRHPLRLPSVSGASRNQLVRDLAPAIRASLSGSHRR